MSVLGLILTIAVAVVVVGVLIVVTVLVARLRKDGRTGPGWWGFWINRKHRRHGLSPSHHHHHRSKF